MNHNTFVFDLQKEQSLSNDLVGGKGSNLCMINKISGILVPHAFCISTNAYRHCILQNPLINDVLSELSHPDITEVQTKESAHHIRSVIENIQLPPSVIREISNQLTKYQDQQLFAIRSSATAEDLPSASFAGQHDSFLNVPGTDAILTNILKCWASLFTDRAIAYRIKNNIEHLKVSMAVVVQQMVHPTASGVMFTADPVSSNRKELTIEAIKGYGDVFVSGEVNADSYKVSAGVLSKPKKQEIEKQILADANIFELAEIGRTIEAHFGTPQDIEWCYAEHSFNVVQSRPITTLFPIPETQNKGLRVYLSTGHQQMMTDAMKPLGISVFAASSGQYMHNAAGRIFYDVTDHLSSPSRNMILNVIGKSEILMRDALQNFINKYDQENLTTPASEPPVTNFDAVLDNDPSVIDELISQNEKSLKLLKQTIQQKKGAELIDFILEDILQRKKDIVDSKNMAALTTSMNTAAWLNENLNQWLGLKNVADTLTQSAPHNITSEMGLALLDVADSIRGKNELIKYLESIEPSHADNKSIKKIKEIPGGEETYNALSSFLDKYGMRCVGEIDISRPRWIEQPYILIPFLLSNVKNFQPGEAERKFNTGLAIAENKKQQIIKLLKQLPEGEEKARITAEKISLLRNFAGYREYPKYAYVCRYLEYKKMLVKEAEILVREKLLNKTEDLFYLSLEEIKSLIISKIPVASLINQRKQSFIQFEKLTPPRVITSDGEIFRGEYSSKHLPENAVPGLAVSSGVAEGRARVIANFSDAKLEDGDILVTKFTDPSWTPAFVSISALVTEVGGLMTHGAVIAREYGLPAVVGVEDATKLIKDGQRIRVNGTEGIVELLSS